MLSSLFCNNIPLQFQLAVPLCISTRYLQLDITGRQLSQHYYEKFIKIKNIAMGKETQVKQEGGTGTCRILTRYCYGNSNTANKPSFKKQHHQDWRCRLLKRAPIWHRNIWGFDRNPNQLHTMIILCGLLPCAINPRSKSTVFGALDQTHKRKQSIRFWVWYGGVWVER